MEIETVDTMATEADIKYETDNLCNMLVQKNRAYGDSALHPIRCFSKSDSVEQILVRIDDKLSRLMRGRETDKFPEDVVLDLLGYLILLRIAQKRRMIAEENAQRKQTREVKTDAEWTTPMNERPMRHAPPPPEVHSHGALNNVESERTFPTPLAPASQMRKP